MTTRAINLGTGSTLSTLLLILILSSSCSDQPQGWTLWLHTYSVKADLITGGDGDDWTSFDTYVTAMDCKNQIQTHLSSLEKHYGRAGQLLKDYQVSIKQEGPGLLVTGESRNKNEETRNTSAKFFCLPLGHDPRLKDPLTWTLWEHQYVETNNQIHESWRPEESYLTGSRCEKSSKSMRDIYRSLEEKDKTTKSQKRISTFFICAPSTINPWGKGG